MDSRTGSYSRPSGTQVQYRFLLDGRYEYASLGNTLTLVPQSGKFTSQDNCIARYNYEKSIGMERESHRRRIERDPYGAKMCLQNEKVNGCAYKR